jgi:hypothetical protein
MTASSRPDTNTPTPHTDAIRMLADFIEETGLQPVPLPKEFFYASLPLCVIDAVFSIGVTYSSTRNTVVRFSERQGWALGPVEDRRHGEKTVGDFLACYAGLSPDEAADQLFGNRQRTSSRSGILKAEAVQRFAIALQESGIEDFADLTDERLAATEAAIRQIPGQKSGISFDYFRMLAGDDNLIKPDRMVQRFIARAIGDAPEKVGPDRARGLLQGAVTELNARGANWSPRGLDHEVWAHQSG